MLAGGISLLPWKEGLEPGILPPSGVSSQLPSCLWLGFPPAAALPCVNHWLFTEQGEKPQFPACFPCGMRCVSSALCPGDIQAFLVPGAGAAPDF